MKKILLGLTAILLSACSAKSIEIEVKNPTAAARNHETVEIGWNELAAKLPGLEAENILVLDTNGQQIPSQVLYEGNENPQRLIFQVSLPGAGTALFRIQNGNREEYPALAFGRFVPERADDYAWENNLGAYRLYGPALADPQTPGIDVWTKNTPRLVIDDWYAGGDYHTDKGEGMDAYKVGRTLGGGGSAPLLDEKLWLSGNYESYERLDNGPLRTTVKLTYAPFAAGSTSVALEKTISLDAHSYFSRMSNVYTGGFETLPVAAGIILHEVKDTITGPDYAGIIEAVSDSRQPETDGDIALAVILPGADRIAAVDGHLAAVGTARNGEPILYWSGAVWSKAGVEDSAQWTALILQKIEQIKNPLIVTVK